MMMTHLTGNTTAAADLLSAMANQKRLMILVQLLGGERPVGALAADVGLSQSALSQHLSKLRARKLVTTRRDAQTIYYSTNSRAVMMLMRTLADIYDESEVESVVI